MKTRRQKRIVTKVMSQSYKKEETLPLEPFVEETSITNTSR